MEPDNNNEPNKKLSFRERLALKTTLKKLKKEQEKALKKTKLNQEQKEEERKRMIECIKESMQIFSIEHKNEELNEQSANRLSYEESLEIFQDTLKALEKIV